MDKKVLKVQAGLNFFFAKVALLAKFSDSGDYENVSKFEKLVCDGIVGSKTSKAIKDFMKKINSSENEVKNESIDSQKLFDANRYYCEVNSDFTYISQRNSKYPNQLCSVASLCMIMDGFGFDISVDDLNNFIDSDKELAAAATAMGFKKYVELNKIEQITAVMVMVLEIFGINAEMVYLTKEQIIEEMHTKQTVPNKKRIIFATSLTQSGHYVVGNFIFKKFANKSFEISIYDPFGNWFTKYKDIDGKVYFPFEDFLTHCKTDGNKNKYRCIIFK